ncbi:unnamed protein product [Caenorhabditis sp. 36 PRJEB53466]|nr:unnamed protein product [Caenorhabditis sp. 36 PRJEB53466]
MGLSIRISDESSRTSLSTLTLEGDEVKDVVVSHKQFVFSDDEQCVIVHATEHSDDIRLELKMKKAFPSCKVVKVSTQAAPDMDNQVEVFRVKLRMTFEKHTARSDQKIVDLDTFTRIHLKNRYIEALYLDESVPFEDLLDYSSQQDFGKLFPVCQLSVMIKRPETKNEEVKFWRFVRYFIVDSQMVLVSSRIINHNLIDVVFYNAVHPSCNFKHFSIPFDMKGNKF